MPKYEISINKVEDGPGCGTTIFWLVVGVILIVLIKGAAG